MSTFESATDRLARLLTMVPWLMGHQGIDVAQAAATFGVSEQRVIDDLQLLFVCGTPGHLPDDLIEASWEHGKVYVGNAEEIAQPLRLGRDEALALIVALRSLAAVPGIEDHDAIDRALVKLEAAAGEAAGSASALSIAVESDGQEQHVLSAVRQSLREHRRLRLSYVVASRDESTQRDVDPMRVLSVDGRWYLEAWCHRAEDTRLFRLDRVETIEVLQVDGTPPEQAKPREVGPGVFRPSPDDEVVRLQLDPAAAWVAEQFPLEDAERDSDGSLVVTLRVADPTWLTRLVWQLGGAVRVLEPAHLVTAVHAGASQALSNPA